MELFFIYVAVFGVSTVIGVPLLSLTQYIFVHNKSVSEWAAGLGTTLGIVTVLFIIVSACAYFALRKTFPILKEAKDQALSEEEKKLFSKSFTNLGTVSFISLFMGYVVGNVLLLVIKAKKGVFALGNTKGEFVTTTLIVAVQCIIYALMAISYCVNVFRALTRKYLAKLHIYDLEGLKVKNFTATIGRIAVYSSFFWGWHIFLSGYNQSRFGGQGIFSYLGRVLPFMILLLIYALPPLWIILLNFRKRLEVATKTIESMRKNGDLSTKINITDFDQFGENSAEINMLIESLSTTISNIQRQASNVSGNAQTLLSTSENSAAGVNQIIATLQEVGKMSDKRDNLLSETQVSVENLTNDAKKISRLFEEQTNETEKNAASITEMVANINSIGEMVKKQKALAVNLSKLSENGNREVSGTLQLINDITEKSKQMMEVTKVIESVASETNLLAMNAAIEAAHAGESGKGFAVVADEIRKLAESTSESTKNIKEMISQLTESIAGSSEKIASTSKAFNEMNSSIQDQMQLSETISNAAEEQALGAQETLTATNQISSQITEINSLINKQADYTDSIDEGIKNIVQLSEQVNEALKESEGLVVDFSKSIEQNKDNAIENENSIQDVNKELNKFIL